MEADLPYLMAPKRFPELLEKIQSAAVPERVTFEFLKKLGFTSSNDRAMPALLKRLGFLDENGAPLDRYREFRHKKQSKHVLAAAIREAYAELFAVHENIFKEDRDAVKDVVSRVSGREQRYVDLIANTFAMLCENADFESPKTAEPEKKAKEEIKEGAETKDKPSEPQKPEVPRKELKEVSFHYNIQIHLPATTDISVYNAIFKSLRQHLGD